MTNIVGFCELFFPCFSPSSTCCYESVKCKVKPKQQTASKRVRSRCRPSHVGFLQYGHLQPHWSMTGCHLQTQCSVAMHRNFSVDWRERIPSQLPPRKWLSAAVAEHAVHYSYPQQKVLVRHWTVERNLAETAFQKKVPLMPPACDLPSHIKFPPVHWWWALVMATTTLPHCLQ